MLTKAERFLLEACLRPDERAVGAWRRWCASVDLEHLDGPSQRLLPLLHRNLQALGVRHPVLRRYQGVWRYNWSKNHTRLARVSHITRMLEERSLPFVALKDLALILAHDPDVGLRSMSEIGFLVRPEDVPQVLDVLAGTGHRPLRRGRGRLALKAEVDSPSIDLRWHLFPSRLDRETDAPFWSRAKTVTNEHGFKGVLVLDRSDLLLHLLVHGATFDRVPPVRWLPDTAAIVRRPGIAWERMAGDAERLGLTRELAAGLRELGAFVELDLPAAVLARLERGTGRAIASVPRFLGRDWRPKTLGALSMRIFRRLVDRPASESTEELR